MEYNFNFSVIWRNFDSLMAGLGLGLFLSIVSIAIGLIIGLVMAFGSMSKNRLIRTLSSIYVSSIRNTPILILILFVYFALPMLGFRFGKIESLIFTLAIYAGAYLSEVFRAGLIALPKGLEEAGMSIGLTKLQCKIYIIIPVMFRNILPSLSNNFISLFKDTSLAATISIPELTYYARKINVETFRVLEVWITASLMYIIASYLIAQMLRHFEQKLSLEKS